MLGDRAQPLQVVGGRQPGGAALDLDEDISKRSPAMKTPRALVRWSRRIATMSTMPLDSAPAGPAKPTNCHRFRGAVVVLPAPVAKRTCHFVIVVAHFAVRDALSVAVRDLGARRAASRERETSALQDPTARRRGTRLVVSAPRVNSTRSSSALTTALRTGARTVPHSSR